MTTDVVNRERFLRLTNQDPSVPDHQLSTSVFRIDLTNDPINTVGKSITLHRFIYQNVIPTIYDQGPHQNNVLEMWDGTKYQKLLLSPGKYTVSDLVSELNRLSRTLKNVKSTQSQGGDGDAVDLVNIWSYNEFKMRLEVDLPANARLKLESVNGCYAVLGMTDFKNPDGEFWGYVGGKQVFSGDHMNPIKAEKTAARRTQTLPFPPDMTNGINDLFIYINPAVFRGLDQGRQQAQAGALLDVVPVAGERGSMITYNYVDSPTFPIQWANEMRHIQVSVLDKFGVPVDFGRLPVSLQIIVKPIVETQM